MATAATYKTFGDISDFGFERKRLRPERIMPKSQQVAKIRQYLSNRGADIDVLDLVEDWVDPTVMYETNKAEIVRRVGFGNVQKPPSNKEMREMYCDSLHNQCASDGLETCQVACDECKNPAACKKAERIKKEIKKYGRELTPFERDEIEIAKEAKRKAKKAKYSVGQTVKCREGYELQCGFSGVRKITQVKRYPDYVIYGIEGKLQGFVEEDWIERIKVKPVKPVPKPKKKQQTDEQIDKEMKRMAKRDEEMFNRIDLPFLKPKFKIGQRVRSSVGTPMEGGFSGFAKITSIEPGPDMVLYGIEHIASGRPVGLSIEESYIKAAPKKKPSKTSKPKKEPKTVELGRDIPRWIKIKNNKYFYSRSFSTKKEADWWANSLRKDSRLAEVKKYKPFIFYLSNSNEPQKYIVWATSPYETIKPPKPKGKGIEETAIKELNKGAKVKSYIHGSEEYEKAVGKYYKKRFGANVVLTTKPPKPTPAKATPKKKKKAKSAKPSLQKKPSAKKSKTSKTLHPKTLTDAQIKHARKYGYVNVIIEGVKKRVTKRNYAPRKRTVQWYKSGGKVHLKVVRK